MLLQQIATDYKIKCVWIAILGTEKFKNMALHLVKALRLSHNFVER